MTRRTRGADTSRSMRSVASASDNPKSVNDFHVGYAIAWPMAAIRMRCGVAASPGHPAAIAEKSSVILSSNGSTPPTSVIIGRSRMMLPRAWALARGRTRTARLKAWRRRDRRVVYCAPRSRLWETRIQHRMLACRRGRVTSDQGSGDRRCAAERQPVSATALIVVCAGPDRAMELKRSLGDALAHRLELLTTSSHPIGTRAREFLLDQACAPKVLTNSPTQGYPSILLQQQCAAQIGEPDGDLQRLRRPRPRRHQRWLAWT